MVSLELKIHAHASGLVQAHPAKEVSKIVELQLGYLDNQILCVHAAD